MTNYCFRIFSISILLLVAGATYGQRITVSSKETRITPFEDYSKCQTGFILNRKDTIFPAKFENLSAVTVGNFDEVFYMSPYRNSQDQFNYVVDVNKSNAWILSDNGKFGCLSDKGKWIIPCKYEDLSFDIYSLRFIAKLNGQYGMINLTEGIVIPFEYDDMKPFQVQGIYDRAYDSTYVARVMITKNNMHGVCLQDGKQVVPPIYSNIETAHKLRMGKAMFVKQGRNIGLYSEDGKLILEPRYQSIELLEDWVKPEWNAIFQVRDTLNRTALFNEEGKQLTPFDALIIYPVYDFSSDGKDRSVRYAERIDSLEKRQLVNLTTGKTSDWYDGLKFIGNEILAYSWNYYEIGSWQILDTNFNTIYTNSGLTDQMWFFDEDNRLEEIKYFPQHFERGEYGMYARQVSDYFGLNRLPSIFAIKKSVLLSNRQQQKLDRTHNEYYCLMNASTGVHSPFVYKNIERFGASGKVYYWCHRFDEYRDWSGETVDVYDSLGVFIRTVCLDLEEENYVSEFSDNYAYYNGRQTCAIIPILNQEGLSGTIHINGTRQLSNFFSGKLIVLQNTNDTTGILVGIGGGYRFFDFQGKPLLDGKVFDQDHLLAGNAWDSNRNNWSFLELKAGDSYMFITPNLDILLDSCSKPFQIDNQHPRRLKLNMYKPTVTIKNDRAYIYLDGKGFVVMDSSLFYKPTTINEIQKGLFVDETGRITDSIPELKPEVGHFGKIYLSLKKNILTVENEKHQLIQTIPNIRKFQGRNEYVLLTTLDKKQGFLDAKTGKWLFDPKYRFVECNWGSGQTFLWAMTEKDTAHWMMIKEDGTPLTEAIFDDRFTFDTGQEWTLFRSYGKLGIINRQLEVVTEAAFEHRVILNHKVVLVKKDKSCFMVNHATGKSFQIYHDMVNQYFSKGHVFLFNDSIQILAMNGEELLAPSKLSDVMSTVNLVGLISGLDKRVTNLPFVANHQMFVPDSNTVLVKLSNEVFVHNAKSGLILFNVMKEMRDAERYTPDCWIEPLWISTKAYSEKISGKCFTQPLISENNYQRFSFRNYKIEPTGVVQITLADLFKEDVNWAVVVDKLIETEIQINQIFGTNCADMPAAVAEFKRNFYIEHGYLTLYSYGINRTIRIPMSKLTEVLKHPEYFN